MKKLSAGILLFRRTGLELEVFLVHPGGPFWVNKDAHSWSIPKGECLPGEDLLTAARREFLEETGTEAQGPFIPLGELRQPSGKIVTAWAVEQDFDPATLHSNTFELEWPPKSGQHRDFPEVDRGAWFTLHQAKEKMLKGQQDFLTRLNSRP